MLSMGIIKVEINFLELKEKWTELQKHRGHFFEILGNELRLAAASAIDQITSSEMAIFLGKPDQNDNKRNGYEVKTYALKGIGAIELRTPIDRKRKFESQIIPKGERIDPRLKEDLAVLHLAGLSTRTLAMISKRLLGVKVEKDQITNSLEIIEKKALEWLERPLTGRYWALYVDGTNFHVKRRGSTEKEPSLVVLAVDENNRKSILAIEPGYKDNAKAWESVFDGLVKRGLDPSQVRIGIMDGLPGLESAFKRAFPKSQTARCWVHAKKNAMAKCPERLRDAFSLMLDKVMYAKSADQAKEAFFKLKTAMDHDGERAVHCIEKDLSSLLVHYQFEKIYWSALKTTNPIERVNKEFKRRSRGMDGMGERTLMCVQAFTALKLQMNWNQVPIDSNQLENLPFIKLRNKSHNEIEEAFNTLLQ